MEDDDEQKLEIFITSSERISNRALELAFGRPLDGIPQRYQVNNSYLTAPRWLNECRFNTAPNTTEFFRLVDRFCKNFVDKHAYVDSEIVMDDLEDVVEADHELCRVEYFALGFWSNLDVFVEQFNSGRDTPKGAAFAACARASFYHHLGYLQLCFEEVVRGSSAKLRPAYMLRVAYSDIRQIVVCRELRHRDELDNGRKEPMVVYLRVATVTAFGCTSTEGAYKMSYEGPWERRVRFGTSGTDMSCNAVGRLRVLAFKLEFKNDGESANTVYSLLRAAGAPVVFANVKSFSMPKNVQPLPGANLSPAIQYALACLQSAAPELGIELALNIGHSTRDIEQLLQSLAGQSEPTLLDAIYSIYDEAKKGLAIDLKVALQALFDRIRKEPREQGRRSGLTQDSLPRTLCLVRKATVCPSKVMFEPPVVVKISPFLRQCDPDYALLVDVRDDTGALLQLGTPGEAFEIVQRAIQQRVQKGLRVAGKTYHFLGASRENFGEHCFWMYAKDESKLSVDELLDRMGIRGTLTDRQKALDLVLTEAIGELTIDSAWVTEVGDDVGDDSTSDELNFRRGVGRISADALDFIVRHCNLEPTCALRVLHGGRAGVLVLDSDLEGSQIIYRRSQRVFAAADSDRLYVVDFCQKKLATIDKVFLTTLSSKQEQLDALFSTSKAVEIFSETISESVALLYDTPAELEKKVIETVPSLAQALPRCKGYDIGADLFFQQAIRCSRLKMLRELKELKLRLPNTCQLMPVVDEYDILEENQVYVQLSDAGGLTTVVLNGAVMVARKDAMHPSEIRRFEAIGGEAGAKFSHLVDCIVFSAKGTVPPMTYYSSDGGYGGDCGVILIDCESLLFRKNDDAPLADHGGRVSGNAFLSTDIPSHYFRCLSYVVANNIEEAFCTQSDLLPSGAYSNKSIDVWLKRQQIDAFFWGGPEPAELEQRAHCPDFLEKSNSVSFHYSLIPYCSNRPVGALFRKTRLLDLEGATSKDSHSQKAGAVSGSQLHWLAQLDEAQNFEQDAATAMAAFKAGIKTMLTLYDVTEEEILTGVVYSVSSVHCPAGRVSRLESVLRCHMRHLARRVAKRFGRNGFGNRPVKEQLPKMAAYVGQAIEHPDEGGYALPWMLPDKMADLISHDFLPGTNGPVDALTDQLLAKVRSSDSAYDIQKRVQEQIYALITKCVNENRMLFVLTGDTRKKLAHHSGPMINSAFNLACQQLAERSGQKSSSEQPVVVDGAQERPQMVIPLLVGFLRNLASSSGESEKLATGIDISHEFFLESRLKALMSNVLIKAAARCSLDHFLEPESILPRKTVKRTIFLPMNHTKTDNDYIRFTQGDLTDFEQKLVSYSMCRQVAVSLTPTYNDISFEQVTAEGEWFAVENLCTLMLMPEFRKHTVALYRKTYGLTDLDDQ